jgi:hypothetical protein
MSDEDDFLMGGGGKSATFEVGDVHRGKILSKKLTNQTDFKTKEILYWPNGDPRKQLVVALATDERDEDDEMDEGVRNLYIRFKMKDAVQAAVKAAGAKTLEIGGTLAVKCVGKEKPRTRGEQGAKLYKAKYTAPDPADYLGEDDPDEVDKPTPPPAKKAAAKKAPAKKAAAKAVDEFGDDGSEDDPGF